MKQRDRVIPQCKAKAQECPQGRKARRRQCGHAAAKGAAEYAVATVSRLKECHHVAVMSNFPSQAAPVAAAAPCHCTAVTGGMSASAEFSPVWMALRQGNSRQWKLIGRQYAKR